MKFSLLIRVEPENEREFLSGLANLVARANAALFLKWPGGPPRCAAEMGIRYRAPTAAEHRAGHVTIVGARELVGRKYGTCGDLAAFDAGAALARGVSASVRIIDGPWGGGSYHAIVVSSRGQWDPSQIAIEGRQECLF